MDLGESLYPAIDIGQIEGDFTQGFGMFTMEELVWGDEQHKWVRPGHLFTTGPGAYKLPSFNDVPLDMRITLLSQARNPFTIHSSKAVGEPPLFLGASVLFAAKEAISAFRREELGIMGPFQLNSPCTPERLRMACADDIAARYISNNKSRGAGAHYFQAKGSW